MPISPNNTMDFHRRLYGEILETLILLKRNDDQQEGTVRSLNLFECRRHGQVVKTKEPIQASMTADNRVTWMIPATEMVRVGVAYINALDRFVDKLGRYWQPEATTQIVDHLFSNYINIDCLRVDPPPATQ